MKQSLLFAGVLLLAVSGNAKAEDWLSLLPDNVAVRELSIPGSHDAATGNGFSGLSAIAARVSGITQSLSLSDQWDTGVRAFDLRPAYKASADGKLQIYHGTLETTVSMKAAVQTLVDKLTASPGEMAVILMRHESDADSNSGSWAGAVADLFGEFDNYIVKFAPNMTLGDARGKIIVLSRDNFSSGKAGMISGWSHSENFNDQTRASISQDGWVELYAQDFYECQTVERKYQAVIAMLNYSTTHTSSSPWVINHTSGYTGSTGTNSNILTLAKSLNIQTADYLNTATVGRTGMVFMDFAGADSYSNNAVNGGTLVNKIIAQNSKYIVNSGIEEVDAATVNDGIVYDLQGRYLGHGEDVLKTLSPGIYIYNRRKIIIR